MSLISTTVSTAIRYFVAMALMLLCSSSAFAQNMAGFFSELDAKPIVFVPGILGSKIYVDDRPVWGEGIWNNSSMAFTPDQEVSTDDLDELDVKTIFRNFKRNVYGDFFDSIEDNLNLSRDFHKFSYDWRASNVVSAKLLHKFLCSLSRKEDVVLIAHSMGGIVVHHWLRNSFLSDCPDGKKVTISSVIFAATPHFGAPKAFLGLIDSISLKKGLDWWFAESLNKYGYTFDSSYELLPFVYASRKSRISKKDDLCISSSTDPLIDRLFTLQFKDEVSKEARFVDIFDAKILQTLGIFRRFPLLALEDQPELYLQDKLNRAKNNICDLLEKKIPTELEGKIHYVVAFVTDNQNGRASDTASGLQITNFKESSIKYDWISTADGRNRFYFKVQYGVGDLTVPLGIALNNKLEHQRHEDFELKTVVADHEGILDDSIFKSLVSHVTTASAKPVESIILQHAMNVPRREVFNRSLWTDFSDAADVEPELTAKAISDAKAFAAIEKSRIYEQAIDARDPILLEAVALDQELLDPKYRAWSAVNSGYEYFRASDMRSAIRVLSAAEDYAVILPISDQKKILPKVYNNLGWSYLNAGDLDLSAEYFSKSIEIDAQYDKSLLGLNRINDRLAEIPKLNDRFFDAGNIFNLSSD